MQVIAQHRFDRLFPAVGNVERFGDAAFSIDALAFEPTLNTLVTLTERRFLQRLERGKLRLCRLYGAAPLVHEACQFLILLTKLADLLGNVPEGAFEFVTRLALSLLLLGEILELLLQCIVIARRTSIIQFLTPLAVTVDSRLDLLGTRLLYIPLLLGLVVLAGTLVPLLLPVCERGFGPLQRIGRSCLGVLCLFQAGNQLIERQFQLRNFRLILVDMLDYLFRTQDRLLQILLLAFAKLIGVLDRLFEPRDLGSNLVVAALDLVE